MTNKIINFLSSMRFAAVGLLIFAVSIAYATFIENDFGSSSARALIFNTWWFEIILILLACSLALNIFKYNLFRREKISILMFHLSFIFILIGAGITRFIGYEGMMRIYEGESENIFLSDDTFLQIEVNDKDNVYHLDKKLYLSGITKTFDNVPILRGLFSNYFSISNSDLRHTFSIEYSDFLPNVVDSVISSSISGVRLSSSSVEDRSGTEISVNEMLNKEILIGENNLFKGVNFTVNNIQDRSVNFVISDSILSCISDYEVLVTSMPPDGKTPVKYSPGEKFDLLPMSLLTVGANRYLFSDFTFNSVTKLLSVSNNMSDSENNTSRSIDALFLKVSSGNEVREITLLGKKGMSPHADQFTLGGLNFSLSYGPKYYELPFSLRLDDAIIDRYPGTDNPSSYASEVIVEDGDISFPFRIFMNNILNYKGYRFYQSNIDMEDESWTGLSVNHDMIGTRVTYVGYAMLMIGIILVFFSKNTRMRYLSNKLNKLRDKSLLILILILPIISYSEEKNIMEDIRKHMIDIDHANMFDRILVQDHGGRIKPLSTLTSEYIRKISRKNYLYNNNSTQIFLGMMANPEVWHHVPIIKVAHPDVRSMLNTDKDRVPFSAFFDEKNEYIFFDEVKEANLISPGERSKFQNELIKVDERVNIAYLILNTRYHQSTLRIFPIKGDENNTWDYRIKKLHNHLPDSLQDISMINIYLANVHASSINNDWGVSNEVLDIISSYQKENGSDVIPDGYLSGSRYNRIEMEVWYNKLNIFSNLFMYYFFVGLILLVLLFVAMFNNTNKIIRILIKIFIGLTILGFSSHIFGLVIRWIISGHAPWSNGYESMIYIAFATILSGFIFLKRSPLTLSATVLISSMILMVAHLNWLDPEVTNLVPVLDSYWLMIHVSIITASYGFLACGALLGFISLMLMIFTNKKNYERFNIKIDELTIINEKTITIGLFMLVIGTFLGGIWANESWGRYWGWDPKETWALVSVLVYALILHMRFIPSINSRYAFNLMSLAGISSIIMTYFGVNYYLSGLHSYAAGDPMPIPVWIYYFIGIVILTAVAAMGRRLKLKKMKR